jgi:glucose 1-dehydrogenase
MGASAFGEEGAYVAINYVGRPEGAIETKEAIEHGVSVCMNQLCEVGGRPVLVEADVSDEGTVERMFDQVLSEYGRLDILINNVGIQIAADSHELPATDFDKVLAVNLRGADPGVDAADLSSFCCARC